MKLVNFLSQKEEEGTKVHSQGMAGREVGKLSKSKRRRRKG
jgi:hypothetical protein